jgi:hypothetical protein
VEGPLRRSVGSVLTPCTLFAHQRMAPSTQAVRRVACYLEPHPTFSYALALVGKELWGQAAFAESLGEPDMAKSGGVRRAPNRNALLCGLNG